MTKLNQVGGDGPTLDEWINHGRIMVRDIEVAAQLVDMKEVAEKRLPLIRDSNIIHPDNKEAAIIAVIAEIATIERCLELVMERMNADKEANKPEHTHEHRRNADGSVGYTSKA